MFPRRLVAVLACRNNGSRLYAKPLQRLDIASGWTILDQVILNLQSLACISEIVLAISEGAENLAYVDVAKRLGLSFVIGDEKDVLSRLLSAARLKGSSDIFRVTSESPFLYWEAVEDSWNSHIEHGYDATFFDNIIDGCGFEIIGYEALHRSWVEGNHRHRSELCTLYIRENLHKFKVNKVYCDNNLARKDLRLTVDYPEDLIVCREIYSSLSPASNGPLELLPIISFLDQREDLKRLISGYTEAGYRTMYL